MERKSKAATFSGVFLLVFFAVLVAVNVLAYPMNKRIDVTKTERWTLSKGSARLVNEGLSGQMTATLWVTRGLPTYDIFIEDMTDLLKEYEKASGGNFKYLVKEAKTEEEKEEAKKAGLAEIPLQEYGAKGDSATISKGFMGLVLEYGVQTAVLPQLSPRATAGLEFWITNKIRELRDKEDDKYQKVGVIVKEGITLNDANLLPPSQGTPNVKQIFQQHLPFYKIEDVKLEDGKEAINPELRGVIVMQPDKDFTDLELQRIDEFLMQGDKSLLVVAGAVNMKASDPKMTADLNLRGLDKLMSGYGINMKKNVVYDWGLAMRLPVVTASGPQFLLHPPILQIPHFGDVEPAEEPLDNSFAGFFRMDQIAFPFASTLSIDEAKQPGCTTQVGDEKPEGCFFKVVARSSVKATLREGERIDLGLDPDAKPEGEYGQHDIAITVEGKLHAAFKKGSRGEGVSDYADQADKESRILVIASGQFLANPYARAGNPPPMPPQMQMMGGGGGDKELQQASLIYAQKYYMTTLLSFKNLLDWMANDKDLMAVSAKLLGNSSLTYSEIERPDIDYAKDDEAAQKKKLEDYKLAREALQSKVQWTLTLFPPLLFILLGVGRWLWREKRRAGMKL